VEVFAELQRAGKCRHVGLSNVSIEQIDAASRIVEVQSVQNRLNPYFRESLDVAAECGRRGITFFAYSPVGGGRLAKKLPSFEILQQIASAPDQFYNQPNPGQLNAIYTRIAADVTRGSAALIDNGPS